MTSNLPPLFYSNPSYNAKKYILSQATGTAAAYGYQKATNNEDMYRLVSGFSAGVWCDMLIGYGANYIGAQIGETTKGLNIALMRGTFETLTIYGYEKIARKSEARASFKSLAAERFIASGVRTVTAVGLSDIVM